MIVKPNNSLKVIDRVKNIFKLSQGEYIVSEKLERAYEQSPLIAQIFIHGDSFRDHIVAIICPEVTQVAILIRDAQQEVTADLSLATMLERYPDIIRKAVEDDLERLAKANNFNSLEKVKANFRFVGTEFEHLGILTPTMKLKRHAAKALFEAQITEMYEPVQ